MRSLSKTASAVLALMLAVSPALALSSCTLGMPMGDTQSMPMMGMVPVSAIAETAATYPCCNRWLGESIATSAFEPAKLKVGLAVEESPRPMPGAPPVASTPTVTQAFSPPLTNRAQALLCVFLI